MKFHKVMHFAVMLLLAILPIMAQTSAHNAVASQLKHIHHHYKLIDLGTFGGPQSYLNIPINYAQVLNNRGMVAGWADTSVPDPFPDFCFDEDCLVAHAFQGRQGGKRDLGTLPGGVSSQGDWISANGLIAGISQNGQIDPLVPGFPEFRAVLWRNGEIIDLETLGGGYESIATSVNSRGQVVGFATNTTPDPNSMLGLGFQTRAFLWNGRKMQDLGTLGTGTNAAALLINERGQVAGNSYTSTEPSELCAEEELGSLTTGAFIWDHGTMVDLGNFGGSCTFASALNNRGEVVGGSRLTGDQAQHPFLWNGRKLIDLGTFGGGLGNAIALNDAGDAAGWATFPGDQVYHAALWKHGKMLDLGTLKGDSTSFATTINARGQIVGVSVPPDGDYAKAHSFLWEDGGPMVDLQKLIPRGSSLRLTSPETINDRGEIAGVGLDANGNQHAFLLIPCSHDDTACQDSAAFRPSPTVTKPANGQKRLRRMYRSGSQRLSGISSLSTPSAVGAVVPTDRPVADETVNETGGALPILPESLEAGLMPRFKTAPTCGHYGMQCSGRGVYNSCCPGLKCVFHGGSTRVGYMCQ